MRGDFVSAKRSTLCEALLRPEMSVSFTVSEWEDCIRQARVSLLTIRLAQHLIEADVYDRVPNAVRKHLDAAVTLRDRQAVAAVNEVNFISEALGTIDVPVVLLKGAAYMADDLPPARCRVFSDFDILVPRSRLADVELAMLSHGWVTTHNSDYDQRYYREWMHELPPMRHFTRASFLDIHHNILPLSARNTPNAEKLLADTRAASAFDGVYTLSLDDMMLHNIVHVFQDGEFDKALRDLFDLRELVVTSLNGIQDWERLIDRARVLGLERPLFYAIDQLCRQLNFSLDADVRLRIDSLLPSRPVLALMRFALDRALSPNHVTSSRSGTDLARLFLFIRGHAIKMPPHRLIVHLARKWMLRAHLMPATQ